MEKPPRRSSYQLTSLEKGTEPANHAHGADPPDGEDALQALESMNREATTDAVKAMRGRLEAGRDDEPDDRLRRRSTPTNLGRCTSTSEPSQATRLTALQRTGCPPLSRGIGRLRSPRSLGHGDVLSSGLDREPRLAPAGHDDAAGLVARAAEAAAHVGHVGEPGLREQLARVRGAHAALAADQELGRARDGALDGCDEVGVRQRSARRGFEV